MLIASPDFGGDSTSPLDDDVSTVEWDTSNANGVCPGGTFVVWTFAYFGDDIDNNNGSGSLVGDDLVRRDEAFAFVIP